MAIQTNNSNVTINTLTGAIDKIHAFALNLAKCYNYSDVYTASKSDVTLERNLVCEINNGKRGGANRLRVYLNKRNNMYAVSIRYGNNIYGHDAVVDACKGYAITDSTTREQRVLDFSQHMEIVASDGKTESRIQFMVSRCSDFLILVMSILESLNDETIEASATTESVTA